MPHLSETGTVPTSTCSSGHGAVDASFAWPWGEVGARAHFGYQAWSTRLPPWLSDASIEEFLVSEGVPSTEIGADITADTATDLAANLATDLETAALRQALIGGAERLGLELLLFPKWPAKGDWCSGAKATGCVTDWIPCRAGRTR